MRLSRILHIAPTLACVVCALVISASAQITITSPTTGSTVSMPVWLRAHASSCNGSANMTGIGYSINNSPFITWGTNLTDIDTTDYRFASQPSPGAQYTIQFKAWSDKGACQAVPVVVNVSGPVTTTKTNVDQNPNDQGWNPLACPNTNSTANATNWFWQWDSGTARCTYSDSSTYIAPSGSPSIDGTSRLFYVDWTSWAPNTSPGERSSELFGNDAAATHFVYDTYIYLNDPTHIQNLEMDTNQVYNSSGDVLIYGLQCAHSSGSWEYTINKGTKALPQDTWVPSTLACDPWKWTPKSWHHVQLVVHRVNENAYYDSITWDGKTTSLTSSGPSAFGLKWLPEGNLLLNFQIDGVPTAVGNGANATLYIDGMTMIYWH